VSDVGWYFYRRLVLAFLYCLVLLVAAFSRVFDRE
jgi:hypothetical protein